MTRLEDLKTFYGLLDQLEEKVGGKRQLFDCHGRMSWPERGVYFFFEPGEFRSESGVGLRVVRVGTHALKAESRTSLWQRLSQHRGVISSGGGNHRGSIFRLLVGAALQAREQRKEPASWGLGAAPSAAARRLGCEPSQIRDAELALEQLVSRYIRSMPLLWLGVSDGPGANSPRSLIERNGIGLLSNFKREALDPPSSRWLGRFSDRERVRESGLWNNNHVEDTYDPSFLHEMQRHIERMPLVQ